MYKEPLCHFVLRNGAAISEHPDADAARHEIRSKVASGVSGPFTYLACTERLAPMYRREFLDVEKV